MTLPASGAISFGQVDTELGLGATTTISLNQTSVRTLFGVPTVGAQISMSNGQGKTNGGSGTTVTITISSNIQNFNAYNNKTASQHGSAVTVSGTYGSTSTVNVVINSGVVVGSTSASTYAFDTGTGWAAGNALTLTNNGYIAGAAGPFITNVTTVGQPGGVSMRVQKAISITNGSGYIYSGGGSGGQGGDGRTWQSSGLTHGGFGGVGGGWGAGNSYTVGHNTFHGGNGDLGGRFKSSSGAGGGAGGGYGVNGQVGGSSTPRAGGGGGGGGPGASGGKGGHGHYGSGFSGGGHGLAITGISSVTWVSGNTRVYGGTA